MEKELRLYAFVPYQLTGIQKGIQMMHASHEYNLVFAGDTNYENWKSKYKTVIVLNGGTTNDNPEKLGTMQLYLNELIENGIKVEFFREPDLNDSLTSFVFLAEEPSFNHKDFPFFHEYIREQLSAIQEEEIEIIKEIVNIKKTSSLEELKKQYGKMYIEWEKEMGGRKNVFLKYFLNDKKLA